MPRVLRLACCALGLVLVAASCGDDGPSGLHAERGVRTLEDVIAPQIGLGPLDARCDATGELSFGDSFACTAETEDGQVILFRAIVANGGVIDMESLNLLTADVVSAIEVAAVDDLVAQGFDMAAGGVECANTALAYDPDAPSVVLQCRALHPLTGMVHVAVVTVTDVENIFVTVDLTDTLADA